MEKVLVTGGAGFIGRHLVHALRGRHQDVAVVDDGRCGTPALLPPNVEQHNCDISQLSVAEWKELLYGVTTVYHLAAAKLHTPSSTADELFRTNVIATQRLAEAAAALGRVRVIFASSLYAYGKLGPSRMSDGSVPEPNTLYGATKLTGESIFRSYGFTQDLQWLGARLFFAFGSGQFADGGYPSVIVKNFERIQRDEEPVVLGSGLQSLDYIHVTDVVAALITLADSGLTGRIVNVCTGVPTTVIDLVKAMVDVSGCQLNIAFQPPDWTEGTTRVGEPSTALQALGWKPVVSLETGLREVWVEDFS